MFDTVRGGIPLSPRPPPLPPSYDVPPPASIVLTALAGGEKLIYVSAWIVGSTPFGKYVCLGVPAVYLSVMLKNIWFKQKMIPVVIWIRCSTIKTRLPRPIQYSLTKRGNGHRMWQHKVVGGTTSIQYTHSVRHGCDTTNCETKNK